MANKKHIEKETPDIEMEDIFDEENVPESNYFKFEKVGDRISGELLEVEDRPAKDPFPESRVFTLKTKDGGIWKVSIARHKTYVISRAARAELGDILGFEFKDEIKSSTKGFANAKSIEVYLKKREKTVDEQFDSM